MASDAALVGGGAPIVAAPPASPRGIAILGSNPATRTQAPFDDPDWLIWACSPANTPYGLRGEGGPLPRVDDWFEIHLPITHPTRPYGYLRFLEKQPVVWMRDKAAMQFFPGARLYPEAELKKRFGPYVFTSSIAFMLAKAIADAPALGVDRIGIWGVMQASPNEYTYQRPGIQQLIWEATRAKLRLFCPPESKLFEPPPEDF